MTNDPGSREGMAGCRLFEGLTAEEIGRCVSSSVRVGMEKGQVLALPERLTEILIVLEGDLHVLLDSGMSESLTHTLGPGDCFGIAFCAESLPCAVRLKAVERSTLLRIPYRDLTGPEQSRDRIMENLLAITSLHLRMLAEKISHTQSRSVRGKLSVYLRDRMRHSQSPSFDLGMTRSGLAEYLCVSYPALLRELTRMQKEGLIRVRGRHVTVPDEEALAGSAQE